MADQPVDAVLQAVLSLSIQTVAGLPQGVDASLAIFNVLEISGRQTVAWAQTNSRRVSFLPPSISRSVDGSQSERVAIKLEL